LEEFVDDYYSVEKFQNAYKRVVVPLGDKLFWPQVDIKGCLEGDSRKKAMDKEKMKKLIRGQFRCLNCGELDHKKNSLKYHLNGSKKRQEGMLLLF
jgi:hypothetical protein